MDDHRVTGWEERLRETARAYEYPPTPHFILDMSNIHASRLKLSPPFYRRRVWALAFTLLSVLIVVLAVPPVRAAVLDFLQVGAIRVFLTPTTTPVDPLETTPSLLDLDGELPYSAAQELVDFPIRLPGYPSDLGLPDRTFVQRLDGQVVILVWTEPGNEQQVRLSLILLGPGAFIGKEAPSFLEEIRVNGAPGLWLGGPHRMDLVQKGDTEPVSMISQGNVLIWEKGGVTYRLESNYSLEEMLQIAESIP